MIKRLNSRSPYVGYAFIAVVISLVCNFSYLLLLVSYQSDMGNHRNPRQRDNRVIVEREGVLSVSGDGFGYIVTKGGDSIYVDRHNVHWLGLMQGDTLRVEASQQKHIEAEHLIMRRVVQRNGDEYDYGALFRGSEQWHILLYQFVFYFVLSFVLLLVMNTKGRDATWRQFMVRSLICLLISFAAYFVSPVPLIYSGEVIPVYKSRQFVELAVVLKSCFMVAVVILYSRIYTLIYREQQISLENELLKNENLTTRYNMLASQINPHFLFNSLSSLSMLVREKDDERALKYIDQLAYTFRYIVQNGNNSNCVKLRSEMQFAEAYSYLFKIRYADKIFFDVDVDEAYMDWLLPPMSLQPLIGNAVKHNVITSKKPFHVSIRVEDEMLVVSNKRIPQLEPQDGTGLGLANLNSRFELIMNRSIEVRSSDEEFAVRLPLVKPDAL
ncbi:MAG: histidine kinase [Alistipes sp.]|nr:histidine kinase [Alistipes sp.]MBR2975980.1 histidine kinase [Alistipes sp.]